MLSLVKKFFQNEWNGIKQAAYSLVRPIAELNIDKKFPKKEITDLNHPNEHKIIKEISDKANIYPENVYLTKSFNHHNATAHLKGKTIDIERGNLKSVKAFSRAFAHELGHIKYNKLHSHLHISYLKLPYKLLLEATTDMYAFGLSAYALMGDNKVLDGANWLFNHTGKYMVAAAITNAVLIRTGEHMADIFAYKQTGLLPSVDIKENRNGIIGNISNVVSNLYFTVESGYPTRIERDIVCKILGGKPKNTSFVEKINSERTVTIPNQDICKT